MNRAVKEAVNLMEILPEAEQNFALEFIKRLVIAWDPDFTKITPSEKDALDEAVKDIKKRDTVSHESINWD